ncbi:MAG: phosphoribosylformylglycinamidine synthase, partial [Francisella sp.]
MIRIFEGLSALSLFKREKILVDAKKISNKVTSIVAKYIHVVELNSELSAEKEQIIKSLLDYNKEYGSAELKGKNFITAPRAGTISPWSSKATDIILNTGIKEVARVERAVLFAIEGEISTSELVEIQNLVHDRMIEEVFADADDLHRLFDVAAPKGLESVDVLGSGEQAIKDADTKLGLALSTQEISYLAD